MRIAKTYMIAANENVLNEIHLWVDTTTSTVMSEYVERELKLKGTFGDLITTPLLHDYKTSHNNVPDDDSLDESSVATSLGDEELQGGEQL